MIALHHFQSLDTFSFVPQGKTIDWLVMCHHDETNSDHLERYFKRFAVKEIQISKRGFCHSEIFKVSKKETENSLAFGLIDQKMLFFKEKATRICQEFYPKKETLPKHLIHVSCTGYVSPSPPQILVSELSHTDTKITHAYHMGCYASMPAVRMAKGFAFEDESIDIVHTELCTLHMNPRVHTPEQMVIQSLFGDGAIKYRVEKDSKQVFGNCFIWICDTEVLVPHSLSDMGWVPESWGFAMNLSKDVAQKILSSLPIAMKKLALLSGYDEQRLLKQAVFAIHPGGPKIIQSVSQFLDLQEWQIASSEKILYERGNMSSATLPHVWQDILDHQDLPSQTPVVSFAFGPGLTIFGSIMILRKG